MNIADYVRRHKAWSFGTFGKGQRTTGLIKHIRKELEEVEAEPDKLSEWCDVIILAIDGAWRRGYTAQQIEDALVEKQEINMARKWNVNDDDTPNEHVR